MIRKAGLIHDWLTTWGGGEMVFDTIAECYPDAPMYTLIHDKEHFPKNYDREIHESFIASLPFAKKYYRNYLSLFPLAVEQFDLSAYDLVLSSCHAVAKGVLTSSEQLHCCYCHTPIRYAWDMYQPNLKSSGLHKGFKGALARIALHKVRNWDIASSNRVDFYIANSNYVARRIAKLYRRPAKVIYPPVDTARFKHDLPREDFYLFVSRFVPYKRMDIIIDAFNQNGRQLVMIGDGPLLEKMKQRANRNIKIMGWQAEEVVTDYMQRCKAFVYAADEDFGIVPVEAQAAGAPVIAWARGGVKETVVDQSTGLLYEHQTSEGLNEAIDIFEAAPERFDAAAIAHQAEQFSKERFIREYQACVDQLWDVFQGNQLQQMEHEIAR